MIEGMKKILATIIIIATLFLPALPLRAEQKIPELILPTGDFSSMHKAGTSKVVEVINPLTIKLKDGRIITLAGLDYPDLDFYDSGKLAVTAQKILEDFLVGKKVVIYQTPKPDSGRMNRMGHHIAHLARLDRNNKLTGEDSAIWIEGLMLSLGLARVRTTKYNRQMAAQMLALENKAREQNIGLWSMKEYSVLTPEQATDKIGSFQLVEGTVKSISRHKNNLYINFGNNWRSDFTIGISGTNMRTFTREHIYPDKWNGAKIRVRGWIKNYNGPFIAIDHPERIEILSTKKPETANSKDIQGLPITLNGSALPEYNK